MVSIARTANPTWRFGKLGGDQVAVGLQRLGIEVTDAPDYGHPLSESSGSAPDNSQALHRLVSVPQQRDLNGRKYSFHEKHWGSCW